MDWIYIIYYRSIITISRTVARSSYVDISILTFQFQPISICNPNLRVLLQSSTMKNLKYKPIWFWGIFKLICVMNFALYGQSKVSRLIPSYDYLLKLFNLIVKQHPNLKDWVFCQTETSPYLYIFNSARGPFWLNYWVTCPPLFPPASSSDAPVISLRLLGKYGISVKETYNLECIIVLPIIKKNLKILCMWFLRYSSIKNKNSFYGAFFW